MEFIAGYTIETSLSVDNLFVFLVIFQGFRLTGGQQHKALAWGVGGAIIMRALFIALGVTLIEHFAWVNYVFGAFLLYAAWRLISQKSTRDVVPHWVRNMHPKKDSLLPVILAVELTDVLFAVDSIPAVLAVSRREREANSRFRAARACRLVSRSQVANSSSLRSIPTAFMNRHRSSRC